MFENKKVLLAYIAVCLIWGSTYLAIRIGVKELPPLLFAGTRFITASIIMMSYGKYKKMKFPKTKSDIVKASITGLLLLTGANGLVVYSEQFIESGLVSLLFAISPIVIMVTEVLIMKVYKIPFTATIGIFIGLGGVVHLIVSKSTVGPIYLFAIVCTLLAAVFWAMGSLYSRHNKIKADIVPIIAYQMLAGGLGQIIIGAFRNEFSQIGNVSTNSIIAWFYLVFIGSIVGYSCYIYILDKLPASIAGTYIYINPLVAVVLGALILKEPFSISLVLSTFIILSGVIIVGVSKNKVKIETK